MKNIYPYIVGILFSGLLIVSCSRAGAEPTGEQVSMSLMMFFRFENGKMVELWEVDDQLGFRRQLGLIPD